MSYGTGRSDPYRALPSSLSAQEACRPGGAVADEGEADQQFKTTKAMGITLPLMLLGRSNAGLLDGSFGSGGNCLAAQCRGLPDSRPIAAAPRTAAAGQKRSSARFKRPAKLVACSLSRVRDVPKSRLRSGMHVVGGHCSPIRPPPFLPAQPTSMHRSRRFCCARPAAAARWAGWAHRWSRDKFSRRK
jgi:hypothetical protein